MNQKHVRVCVLERVLAHVHFHAIAYLFGRADGSKGQSRCVSKAGCFLPTVSLKAIAVVRRSVMVLPVLLSHPEPIKTH